LVEIPFFGSGATAFSHHWLTLTFEPMAFSLSQLHLYLLEINCDHSGWTCEGKWTDTDTHTDGQITRKLNVSGTYRWWRHN